MSVYPNKSEISDCLNSALTYDLHNADFRRYWVSRTGITFNGNRVAGGEESVDITDRLIAADTVERRTVCVQSAIDTYGASYRVAFYQHVWNIYQTER